jgi:hypothetical protein
LTGPLAQGCIRRAARTHRRVIVYREKSTASSEDLGLHARLSSDTIRLGEPFLVTAMLTNVSRELQYVPIDPLCLSMNWGLVSFILRDSSQQFTNYATVDWLIGSAPEQAFPVPPSESIYLQRLVLMQRFIDARKARRARLQPGSYRLIVRFSAPRFDSTGKFLIGVDLNDSVPVVVIQDSGFDRMLGSLKNRMDTVLDKVPGVSDTTTDSLLPQLKRLLAGSGDRYPGEAYLVPYLLGMRPPAKTAAAIAEAQDFIQRYPASALTEEMSFELLDFLYPAHDTIGRDSLALQLVTRFPRNAHAVTSRVGHQVWEKPDRFAVLKGVK